MFEEVFSHFGFVVHDLEVFFDLVKILGVDVISHLMKLLAPEPPEIFFLRNDG